MGARTRGRDAIYAGMRSPEGGGAVGILPTLEMQGMYRAPGGVLELNPGWTARPRLSDDSVRAQRLSEADRTMLDAGEATRALVDAQQAGGYQVAWLRGPLDKAHSLAIEMPRKALPGELRGIEDAGGKAGLPNVTDLGHGLTVTRWSPPPDDIAPALSKGDLIADIRAAAPEAGAIDRAMVEGNLIDYSRAWRQGAGSGAATRQMLGYVNKSSEARAALNSNALIPRKALGNLERDAEWAQRLEATRDDVQNLRRIIAQGPGWIDRLEEALKTGAVLPALAGLVLATAMDPASEP